MHSHDSPEALSGLILTNRDETQGSKPQFTVEGFPQNPEAKEQKTPSIVLAPVTECARMLDEQTECRHKERHGEQLPW